MYIAIKDDEYIAGFGEDLVDLMANMSTDINDPYTINTSIVFYEAKKVNVRAVQPEIYLEFVE